jgi:hypothetical protein
MGAPLFFPAIFFILNFFLYRGFFGFFIPSVNSTKKKIVNFFSKFLVSKN